jgi:acetyl/propionyl-CoA carboxylase alpha subunit/acetyl-CoA carboxylase carboxyltransferase component
LKFNKILIANRGEIAIRIARAAADLGLETVAVFTQDDEACLHTRASGSAHALPGRGARGYLDVEALIAAARATGCEAVHPGYGFLSERADFALACIEAGLTFIGPSPEHLELFGDKTRARAAARAAGVPILDGVEQAVSLEEAQAFLARRPAGEGIILKAVAGGGGRGTRVVMTPEEVAPAYARCRSEAAGAFGVPDIYVEAFLPRARHIEVQVLGDQGGAVTDLGERDCSLQRRFQKVVEIAPAPNLPEAARKAIIAAALRLASDTRYVNLGTFEFLVDATDPTRFFFIEANARLQVEHTVTEAVTGVDLVQAQLQLARGASLAELGLYGDQAPRPKGFAVQARLTTERLSADGALLPSSGILTAYDPPGGPGLRVDGCGYSGYPVSGTFDSLLAKVIGHSPAEDIRPAIGRTARGLAEFRIEGVETNIPFLQAVLAHPDVAAGLAHTRWIEDNAAPLAANAAEAVRRHFVSRPQGDRPGLAGAKVDSRDPLALFGHGAHPAASTGSDKREAEAPTVPAGSLAIRSPMQGTVVSIDVAPGDPVRAGQQVAVVEAMKLEHVLAAECDGVVRAVSMAAGEVVREGHPLVFVEPGEVSGGQVIETAETDPDLIRPDLEEALRRHALTLDKSRPEAVAKRQARGFRMPRENIADLVDEGSFKEYWPLVVARQHRRFDMETLQRTTPADGLVVGTCTINSADFGEEESRALVVHSDYTVLAGTQGARYHYKMDRALDLAQRYRLPLVLFGEGGGGRPGDDNTGPGVAFDTPTFIAFSQLSGLVPLVSVINGRTFAGNAAVVACSDVIIATEGSTLGMGGPAMIEGGGLGVYTPEEVGPMSVQSPNGVVDILVKDEAEAVQAARKYLSYFQGALADWREPDQRRLRHIVPENRLRLYDMRAIIRTLADEDSVLELRAAFGPGLITAFIRVEGRAMGVIANNPHHLAGAIDSDVADKGARFLQLCDAFDIPVLSLMDCPGMMVGPEVERTALVRHCARMFNVGSNMTTPLFGVVVRKGYGLGVQAMCGGGSLYGFFTIAWPTAEFSGMNIEGAVKLGWRKELQAIEDPAERRAEFDRRVAQGLESAKAINAAVGGGLDDVIDPAETRNWIASALKRVPRPAPRQGKKHAFIDTW